MKGIKVFNIKTPLGGYISLVTGKDGYTLDKFACKNYIDFGENGIQKGRFVYDPHSGMLWVFIPGKKVNIAVLSHEMLHAVIGLLIHYEIETRDEELLCMLLGILMKRSLKKLKKHGLI